MWTLLCLLTGELVKELNSGDLAAQEKAVKKADCLVASLEEEKTSKSHINRTVINPNPSCVSRPVVNDPVFILWSLHTHACKHYIVVSVYLSRIFTWCSEHSLYHNLKVQ